MACSFDGARVVTFSISVAVGEIFSKASATSSVAIAFVGDRLSERLSIAPIIKSNMIKIINEPMHPPRTSLLFSLTFLMF